MDIGELTQEAKQLLARYPPKDIVKEIAGLLDWKDRVEPVSKVEIEGRTAKLVVDLEDRFTSQMFRQMFEKPPERDDLGAIIPQNIKTRFANSKVWISLKLGQQEEEIALLAEREKTQEDHAKLSLMRRAKDILAKMNSFSQLEKNSRVIIRGDQVLVDGCVEAEWDYKMGDINWEPQAMKGQGAKSKGKGKQD